MIEACNSNKSAGCAGGTVPSEPIPEGPPLCENQEGPLVSLDKCTFKYSGYYTSPPIPQTIEQDGAAELLRWWLDNSEGAIYCRLHDGGADEIDAHLGFYHLKDTDFEMCQLYSEAADGYDFVYHGWAAFDVSVTFVTCEGRLYPFYP